MKYRYSLYEDLKIFLHTRRSMDFFAREGIYVIPWTLKRYIKFLWNFFTYERPDIDVDMTCYFVSCGTWGAYELPDKVYVCPIDIEYLDITMRELIMHEIAHIKHEDAVQGMTHKEKEEYIDNA